MPLLKGKSEVGHNIAEMEAAGHPRAQAVAAALRTAGAPRAKDGQPALATGANAAPGAAGRLLREPEGGSVNHGKPMGDFRGGWSAADLWRGRRV